MGSTGAAAGDRPTADALTRLLVGVTVTILVAWLAVWGLERAGWLLRRPYALLNVAGEQNLPTWWNGVLLVLVGAAAAVAATRPWVTERRERIAWWVVAFAAAALSLDEGALLHERVLTLVRSSGWPTWAWLLPGALQAGGGLLLLVWACRALPRAVRHWLAVAAAVYVTGALVIDNVNERFLAAGFHQSTYVIGGVVEEGLEMGAAILAFAVIWRQIRHRSREHGTHELVTVTPAQIHRMMYWILGSWTVIVLIGVILFAVGGSGRGIEEVRALFDLTARPSVVTWWQTAALVLVALALVTHGASRRIASDPDALRWCRGAALVALALSMSQATDLHRIVGRWLGASWSGVLDWTVVGAITGVALFVACRATLGAGPRRMGRRLAESLVGLLAGAVVLEAVVLLLRASGARIAAAGSIVAETMESVAIAVALAMVMRVRLSRRDAG